jgi:glycosyltransferase involved in cell wall biosynthesis
MASAPDGDLVATIVIPTMKDRGPLLPVTMGSVQAQSVREIEIFIIGDGVDDDTRGTIHDLMAADARIRFFDFEKHPRRGEPNRHEALKEARGRIICYMCDRDLMLPNHVATLAGLLENADFAHTLISAMTPEGGIRFQAFLDLSDPDDRQSILQGWTIENGIPLSCTGHTLAMYRRLPHGWRTTPQGLFTDIYMWEQFLAQPDCRAVSGTVPTILYFPRYWRNDMSVAQKREELERWQAIVREPDGLARVQQLMLDGLAEAAHDKAKRLRRCGALRRPLGRVYRRVASLWA